MRHDRWQSPDFHPEFGLLCPSPRQRRVMRLAMFGLLAATTIGVTMGLAAANRSERDPEVSVVATSDDAPRAVEAPAPATGGEASPVSNAASPVSHAPEPCRNLRAEDPATSFLNPACKLRVRHGARANNRVATVVIGRTEPVPVTGASTGALEPDPAANADKSATASAVPAEQTVATAKKPKPRATAPIALGSPRQDGWQNTNGVSAYAADPRLGRPSFGPFGNIFSRPW